MTESAYTISTIISQTVVKAGESFEIEVYISGYREIKDNKLQIYYSTLDFIDPIDPGYIIVNGLKEGNLFKFGNNYTQKKNLDVIGQQIGFASPMFAAKDKYEGMEGRTPKGVIPMIMTEVMVESTPPILIHFNTHNKVKSGDYKIHIIFTYSSDGINYKIAENECSLHVTDWAERNASLYTIIQLVLAFVAFFSGSTIVRYIWEILFQKGS